MLRYHWLAIALVIVLVGITAAVLIWWLGQQAISSATVAQQDVLLKVRLKDGASVVVPQGALPTGSRVTLRKINIGAVPPAPEGFRLTQPIYEIKADRLLQSKVTVLLPLPMVEADDIFLLARHAGKRWEAVPFDVKDGLAVVETERLSLWTFLEAQKDLGPQEALISLVSVGQQAKPYLSVDRYLTAFKKATGLDRYVDIPLETTSPEIEIDDSQAGGLIAVSARVINGRVRLRVRNLVKFYLHLAFDGPAEVQPVRGAYIDRASVIDVSNLITSSLKPGARLYEAVANLFKEMLPKDVLLLPEGTAEFVTNYLPGKNLTVSAKFSEVAAAFTTFDPFLGLVPLADMELLTAVRDLYGAKSRFALALPGLEHGWRRRAVELLNVPAAALRVGLLLGEEAIKTLAAKLVLPQLNEYVETVEGRAEDLIAVGEQALQGATVIVRYFPPTFDIALNRAFLVVAQGSSGTTTVTITPKGDFTGTLNLSLESAPVGITLSPSSVRVRGTGPVIQDLTIRVDSGVGPRIYNLRVKATSGRITKTADLILTVTAVGTPKFDIDLEPASIILQQGTSGTVIVNIKRNETMKDPVDLFVEGVPVGVKIAVDPARVPAHMVSATMRIEVGLAVSARSYTLTIRGRAAGIADKTATFKLTVTTGQATSWTRRNSSTDITLTNVAYLNGVFVAVGLDGTILTSYDGITWKRRDSGTSFNLHGIAYGNGVFVAVGGIAYGTILTSNDGVNWTTQISAMREWLRDVTYGNGIFVAVGEYGTILTSYNGVNWMKQSSGTRIHLEGVTYGNDVFVAIGHGTILTSHDGVKWVEQSSGIWSLFLRDVTYGNGVFVAVGVDYKAGEDSVILSSRDGIIWTRENSAMDRGLLGVTYVNGTFIAVGKEGTILTSRDCVNWITQSSGVRNHLWGVTYGKGIFVAVGTSGTILTSP